MTNLVAPIPAGFGGDLDIRPDEIGFRSLPPSLAILLNERLYERTKAIAAVMSRANGMTPRHLIGQGEACFSVVTMAMDWRLSWHFVARHTYQTPGGSIGFDGALVQSILEASGKFIGAPSFEYRGDWRVLAGKFRMQQSGTGKSTFPVATWTDADAVGLGIIVRWQVKGENVPRVWPGDDEPFWLVQCQPRNSPLWATDPKTQIRYLGIRRFANMAAPGVLGSASFDRDEMIEAAELARDVTPSREPRREDWTQTQSTVSEPEPEPQETFSVVALDGEAFDFETADHAIDALRTVLTGASRAGRKMFEAAVENNADVLQQLDAAGAALIAEFPAPEPAPKPAPEPEPVATAAPPPAPAPSPAPARAAPPPPAPAATAPPPPAATVTEPPGPPPVRESAPPPSQPPEPVEANPAPPPAAAPPVHDDRFPGDLPPGQRLGGTPPPPAGEGGERQSKFIPVPQSRGKPDYRTLIRGLLITKIRQQTDPNELAWLLGDNAQSIEAARTSLRPDDIRELDEAIEFAWQRLR